MVKIRSFDDKVIYNKLLIIYVFDLTSENQKSCFFII